MYSVLGDAALPAPGFPIRRSTGQRLFSASPWLIAAVHVLLRLLVPRHPPCALTILTVSCSPDTNVRRARLLILQAPPPMSVGKRKERYAIKRSAYGAPSHNARPSAVFKVHGGDQTGVYRRRL